MSLAIWYKEYIDKNQEVFTVKKIKNNPFQYIIKVTGPQALLHLSSDTNKISLFQAKYQVEGMIDEAASIVHRVQWILLSNQDVSLQQKISL